MSRRDTSSGTTRRGRDGARARRGRSRYLTLPQLLSAAVEANPTAIAVVEGDRSLTYAELDEASSRLARVLIARGAGPETFVAMGITRSVESVLATWAIAKTGAAFVPVDPTYPPDRITHMVSDSGAGFGVTTTLFGPDLPTTVDWLELDSAAVTARCAEVSGEPISYADRRGRIRVDNTAYVIYTSGSTGLPKGVLVTHGGLSNLAAEQRDRFVITPESRTLHFASPSFDASVLELLLAVGVGATMVIVPPSVYGGTELTALIRDQASLTCSSRRPPWRRCRSGRPRRNSIGDGRRRGVLARSGGEVGRRQARLLQRLRTHRDHHPRDEQPAAERGRADADRRGVAGSVGLCPRRAPRAGAAGNDGRVVHRRTGSRAWIPRPVGR